MTPVIFPARRINGRLFLMILGVLLAGVVTVFVVHRIQVSRNADGLATLARARRTEGRQDEAIMLFARYLGYRPNDASAQAEFATLLVQRAEKPDASRGDRSFAYDALELAVSKNPGHRGLRFKLAEFMMNAGRFGSAGDQLDILLAEYADASGETDSAEAAPTLSAENRNSLLLMRARASIGTGYYQQAAEILATICGFDLEKKGFTNEDQLASPELTSANEASSNSVIYQASLFLSALLDEKLRDPESARVMLDRLIEIHPQDCRSWLARANWHRTNNDLDRAAADLARAESIAPDDEAVLFTSVGLALAQDRILEATQLAERSLGLFPNDERSYRALASVRVRENDLVGAVEVLRKGLAAKLRDQRQVEFMLMEVFLQQNDLEAAEAAMKKHVEQYGDDDPNVAFFAARLLVAQRRWLAARKQLEAVRPLFASAVDMTKQVDLYLGQCHEQLGEFDEQLAANRRVLSKDHTSIQARIGAAAALATTGRTEDALAEYESIAASLDTEQLASSPQVWNVLLQLLIGRQLKRPSADRDWSQVDRLLDRLSQSPSLSGTQMALLKSDVLLREGNAAGAMKLLRSRLGEDPRNPQLVAAITLLTSRTEGLVSARKLLALSPPDVTEDPVVMLLEAQLVSRLPDEEESNAVFARLEAKAASLKDERAGSFLAGLSAIRRSLGNFDEAERLLRAALARRPEDPQLFAALFELACARSDVEKADKYAAEIGRLTGENSPQARVAAAGALTLRVGVHQQKLLHAAPNEIDLRPREFPLQAEQLEQLQAATNLLIEAENERPNWVRIQRLFGEIAMLRGDVPEAIARLQQATSMGQADPALFRQLLTLLFVSNRLQEAQQTLDKLGPDGLSGLERVSAEIELNTGRFDQAVALAERSLTSLDKASPADLVWFGQLLGRAGQVARAIDVLQRAVTVAPDRAEAWLSLILSHLSAGQPRSAELSLQRAATALSSPQREFVLAQGAESLGRLDDAEKYLRKVRESDPQDATAARSLASFLVRRGDIRAAREELRSIIETTTETPEAIAVRTWARRSMAILLGQSGAYRDVQEALGLLEANALNGELSAEDASLKINILANRAEPSSWRKAIDAMDLFAKRQPLTLAQRMLRVQLLDKCGLRDDARRELLAIASLPNAPPAVHVGLVERLIGENSLDTAKLWLKRLSDRTPDSSAVLTLRAKLAIAEKDRPTAEEAVRKLLPTTPSAGNPENMMAIAGLLETIGFEQLADGIFEQYATSSTAGTIARASFLARQRRLTESLDLLERTWQQIPLLPLLQTALTAVRVQDGLAAPDQRQRVAEWFLKAERQDPESTPQRLLLAEFKQLDGDDDAAIGIYRRLLETPGLHPLERAITANNLAFLLARPETAAEAEKLIELAVLELGPNPDILDTRGVVMLAAGKSAAAVSDLREAVLAPSSGKYMHLACALAADGQIEAAREALAEAKRRGLNPRSLNAEDQRRLDVLEATTSG